LKVSAYLPSFCKRSQGGFSFKKLSVGAELFLEFSLVAVLFPTFALQYHVPFRNEIEQGVERALEVRAGCASLFYGARHG
jgi:hypothetical protein